MKKLARILVFSVLVSTFIFGCTSDEENNDSKSPTEQNENASQENSSNENAENDNSNSENKTSEDAKEEDTKNQSNSSDEEKQTVIKLYASELETKSLVIADSESYTIELLGNWDSYSMQKLGSKSKWITKNHYITLDFSETIGYFSTGAFNNCENLTVKIGRNFFDDATFTISYSHNISDMFRGCRNIVIKDGVTEIPKYAFYTESFSTPYLESITIPASVKKIGYQAFFGCSKLKEVIFEDSTESIELSYNKDGGPALFGQGLFYDCPLEKVYVGRNLIYKKEGQYGFSPFSPRRTSTNMKMTVGKNVTSY